MIDSKKTKDTGSDYGDGAWSISVILQWRFIHLNLLLHCSSTYLRTLFDKNLSIICILWKINWSILLPRFIQLLLSNFFKNSAWVIKYEVDLHHIYMMILLFQIHTSPTYLKFFAFTRKDKVQLLTQICPCYIYIGTK